MKKNELKELFNLEKSVKFYKAFSQFYTPSVA